MDNQDHQQKPCCINLENLCSLSPICSLTLFFTFISIIASSESGLWRMELTHAFIIVHEQSLMLLTQPGQGLPGAILLPQRILDSHLNLELGRSLSSVISFSSTSGHHFSLRVSCPPFLSGRTPSIMNGSSNLFRSCSSYCSWHLVLSL